MTLEKILVADDEPLMRRFIVEALQRKGKEVVSVANGEEAIAKIQEESFDLVITDLKMPRKDGLDVLKAAKALFPQMPVLIATAFASVETAVEAMSLGAFYYLIKPFSPESLYATIEKADEHTRLIKENTYLREKSGVGINPALIAKSPAMQKIVQDLEKIAKSQASILITGESGTGKEVIAGAIHALSTRSSEPFIKVNCAAIPDTLIESEFFGHEKGAFTGALTRKTGRFELADKGTLLLDEVTEIPLALQAKLLRVIQEQEFERVGGTRPLRVNVRIVATSNRTMKEAIEKKIFREDLYYRLNVVPIEIPPLRGRPEDILPLAQFFLKLFCKENHKPERTLSPKETTALMTHSWPGNVRELSNTVERAVVLDLPLDEGLLPLAAPETNSKGLPLGIPLSDLEKRFILQTFEAQGKNRTKTAHALGINVRTLRNKLHEYGTVP